MASAYVPCDRAWQAMQPMIISASFGIGGILLATLIYVIRPVAE